MRTKDLKSSKAITLIALVVTIIVLLILAGVAISVLTGENGILKRATDAKLINEKGKVEELIKMAYMSKKIDSRGGTPSKETLMSEIILELRRNGYDGEDDIKTVTNAGSTYSGIEMTDGVDVIDTTGNELSKITLMQGQSKTFTVSLQRTAGESKVYVKIQGKYYEIICTDTTIGLSENGEASVAGEEYIIKVTPPSANTATITLVSEAITEEAELVSGTTLTVTATQNMGLATFNINVYKADGVTKTAEKTGTIDTVLLPKRPTSVTVSSAGNVTSIEKGSDLQLSVSTSPYSTEEMTDTINWSIQSGSGVATVSQTGLVHAVTTGSVTIRASAVSQEDPSDVSAYGEITLTVTPKNVSVTVGVHPDCTGMGTVTVSPPSGTNSYLEGSQITLTATPNGGYEFEGWYIGNSTTPITTNPYNYQVPIDSSATTIAAKFKEEVADNKHIDSFYVQYNVAYTDVYTGTPYDQNTGWRLITKIENDTSHYNAQAGTYEGNIDIISTGIPAKLYYDYNTIANFAKSGTTKGLWAGDSTDRSNYVSAFYGTAGNNNVYAASGLFYNFGNIVYKVTGTKDTLKKGSGGVLANKQNYGGYIAISKNGSPVAASDTTIGDDLFKISNLASGTATIRSVSYKDINGLGTSDTGTAITDQNDVRAGLFRLQGYTPDAHSSGSYWLASPYGDISGGYLRYVRYEGFLLFYSSNAIGVRPVVSITGVKLKKNGNVWQIVSSFNN